MTPPQPVSSVCAWCGRARNDDGEWEPIGEQAPGMRQATHGICPDCLDRETRAAVAHGAFGLADQR